MLRNNDKLHYDKRIMHVLNNNASFSLELNSVSTSNYVSYNHGESLNVKNQFQLHIIMASSSQE